MNHTERLEAADFLTKQAWDNDAWYSWIPAVGSFGNAINSASKGNWGNAALNAGLGILDVATVGAAGTAVKAGIKGGAKLIGNYAAKKAPGSIAARVGGATASGATNLAAKGSQLAGRVAGSKFGQSGVGKGLGKVYGLGARSPKLTLGLTAGVPLAMSMLGGPGQQQQQMAGGMPGWNSGGQQGGPDLGMLGGGQTQGQSRHAGYKQDGAGLGAPTGGGYA